jgi:hypothetical protein
MVRIDEAIAAIVARELIECTMFVTSHVGAVIKNSTIEARRDCIIKAAQGVGLGFLGGLLISLIFGFTISKVTDNVEIGMETGTAIRNESLTV